MNVLNAEDEKKLRQKSQERRKFKEIIFQENIFIFSILVYAWSGLCGENFVEPVDVWWNVVGQFVRKEFRKTM